jgi:hypothetical protein
MVEPLSVTAPETAAVLALKFCVVAPARCRPACRRVDALGGRAFW